MPSSSFLSNPTVSYQSPGVYTVIMIATNAFGSSDSVSQTLRVSECLSILESSDYKNPISVFPNPSSGKFILETEGVNKINIYDVTGKQVLFKLKELSDSTLEIDLQENDNGFYWIRIFTTKQHGLQPLKWILNK